MPEISAERINHLIEHAYAAGLDHGRWQDFVDQLAAAYPGAGVSLIGHDLDGRRDLGVVASGYDPAAVATFEEYYGAINPWSQAISAAPVGVAIVSDDLFPRHQLQRTEFYADWLRPQDDLVAGVGAVAHSDGKRFLMFAFTMPDSVHNRHLDELTSLCNLLGPHLRHSFDLSRRLAGAEFSAVRRQSFEMAPSPLLVVDSQGILRTVNSLGHQLLNSGELITGGEGSALAFLDPPADLRLRRSLAAIQRRDYAGVSAPFPVYGSRSRTEYVVTVSPYVSDIELDHPVFGYLVEDRPIAVIYLTPTLGPDPNVLDSRLIAHGLTRAERSLALAMHSGQSLQAYADGRSLSIHTVRNQLRAVYDKLNVRRQSELAVLMSRLANAHHA
jgi:DNA-binding CsgD family transcriptional regulator